MKFRWNLVTEIPIYITHRYNEHHFRGRNNSNLVDTYISGAKDILASHILLLHVCSHTITVQPLNVTIYTFC